MPADEISLRILDTTKPDVGARKADGFTYPRWSLETKPYWDACRRGELLYQRCRACNEIVFHPRALCPYCLAGDLEWRRSAGRGTLYSFTEQYIPLHRERPGVLPRILGIVALDEGYHMFTEIRLREGETPSIGMTVAVFFDAVAADLTLPKFAAV